MLIKFTDIYEEDHYVKYKNIIAITPPHSKSIETKSILSFGSGYCEEILLTETPHQVYEYIQKQKKEN